MAYNVQGYNNVLFGMDARTVCPGIYMQGVTVFLVAWMHRWLLVYLKTLQMYGFHRFGQIYWCENVDLAGYF